MTKGDIKKIQARREMNKMIYAKNWMRCSSKAKDILTSEELQLYLTLRFKERITLQEEILEKVAIIVDEIVKKDLEEKKNKR